MLRPPGRPREAPLGSALFMATIASRSARSRPGGLKWRPGFCGPFPAHTFGPRAPPRVLDQTFPAPSQFWRASKGLENIWPLAGDKRNQSGLTNGIQKLLTLTGQVDRRRRKKLAALSRDRLAPRAPLRSGRAVALKRDSKIYPLWPNGASKRLAPLFARRKHDRLRNPNGASAQDERRA